jgi:type I restriction enzyme S subunit
MDKVQIGDLIEIVDERNNDSAINAFFGININKEFMPTVANTDEIDPRKYKVVRKNRFVFSGMQTGRDECIRIGLYTGKESIIVSPAYTTFEIVKPNLILNEYFFMNFLSKEMDRYGWFLSDSSIRSNLDWDRFCEIEIELPSVPIQQKSVDVYNALLTNQQAYENSLEDLNAAIAANIKEFKHTAPRVPVGKLLDEIDVRNRDGKISNVQGININKEFMPSVANLSETDLTKYKVVNKNQFAANFMHVMRDKKIPFGLYNEDKPCIVSPAYFVFIVKSNDVLAEYLMGTSKNHN